MARYYTRKELEDIVLWPDKSNHNTEFRKRAIIILAIQDDIVFNHAVKSLGEVAAYTMPTE